MNHSSCGTTIDYLCLVVVSTLSWSRPEIFRESMGTSQPRLINKGYPWVLSIDSTWLGLLISMRLFLWSRVFCGDVVSKPQSCRLTRVDKFPIFAAQLTFRFHNAAWAITSAKCHLVQTYTRTQLIHNRSTDFTGSPQSLRTWAKPCFCWVSLQLFWLNIAPCSSPISWHTFRPFKPHISWY